MRKWVIAWGREEENRGRAACPNQQFYISVFSFHIVIVCGRSDVPDLTNALSSNGLLRRYFSIEVWGIYGCLWRVFGSRSLQLSVILAFQAFAFGKLRVHTLVASGTRWDPVYPSLTNDNTNMPFRRHVCTDISRKHRNIKYTTILTRVYYYKRVILAEQCALIREGDGRRGKW